MKIVISKNSEELGQKAAAYSAEVINKATAVQELYCLREVLSSTL